ncbi:DDE Tnp4 domain-containing protein [Trichonephila inaurata madagascariensis]|uniref:DDE Tnp4 domain-containing protein n=1 Tax=Trichonephila inaurata madagascariensis TaxID=2747483 RepID=A0A8X6Y3X2_9ARAC|nr:DDE Tnp4 domain-containing protein [Trichonephila inaurata madagascariensis]
MPLGAICFVSHLHCGRISEKELFLRSKPMDLLEPNDVVMADKGFLIEEELDKIGCKLKSYLFLKDKILFHASEIVSNCKLSNKRVMWKELFQESNNINILEVLFHIKIYTMLTVYLL